MNKHTPKPWIKRACGTGFAIDFNLDQEQICDHVYEELDADLICAAPDLLAALKSMVSKATKQNWNDMYPDELNAAFAAIDKAEGAA